MREESDRSPFFVSIAKVDIVDSSAFLKFIGALPMPPYPFVPWIEEISFH